LKNRREDRRYSILETLMSKIELPIFYTKEVLSRNPRKYFQQRKVTKTIEDKHQNGKSTTETKLMGKKARKLRKKRDNIVRLQEVLEDTS
jgi:hypothetical protein